jgi:hypothetical protein
MIGEWLFPMHMYDTLARLQWTTLMLNTSFRWSDLNGNS